jgi:hypothetical protein
MQIAYRLIILFGVGLLLSELFITPGPNFFKIAIFLICFFGLVLAFIMTLIVGFASWRKSSRLWMYPALLCVAFILTFIISVRIGVPLAVDTWQFKKHMAAYDKIVDSIQSGDVSCGSTITGINITNLPPGIRNILAARCPDGSVYVEFVGKGSSFAGHSGYLFKNYTETNNCITENIKPEQNEYLQHITGNWYRFSDSD